MKSRVFTGILNEIFFSFYKFLNFGLRHTLHSTLCTFTLCIGPNYLSLLFSSENKLVSPFLNKISSFYRYLYFILWSKRRLLTFDFALCTLHFALLTLHFELCSLQFAVCSFTFCIVPNLLSLLFTSENKLVSSFLNKISSFYSYLHDLLFQNFQKSPKGNFIDFPLNRLKLS